MNKNIFTLFAAALLCMGVSACGGSSSPIGKYCDVLEETWENRFKIGEDIAKGKITSREIVDEITDQFMGQEISTELEDAEGFEIIQPFKVIDLSPRDNGIEFGAIIKAEHPRDFVYIACHNSEPIKMLKCTHECEEEDNVFKVKFFQYVGNLFGGGEKADEKLRSINRIVITEYGSDIYQKATK